MVGRALPRVRRLRLPARAALDPAVVAKLATGDGDEKVANIAALVASGDPRALVVLQALADGEMQVASGRVLLVKGEEGVDAVTGEKVVPLPAAREDVVANNRLRREIEAALAALRLLSPDRDTRLAAARELAGGANEAMLPLVKKAIAAESDAVIRPMLELTAARARDPQRRQGHAHRRDPDARLVGQSELADAARADRGEEQGRLLRGERRRRAPGGAGESRGRRGAPGVGPARGALSSRA